MKPLADTTEDEYVFSTIEDNIWEGALALLLGWISSPGGGPTTQQVREIEKHVTGIHVEDLDMLIRKGVSGHSHPIELACDILRIESDNYTM